MKSEMDPHAREKILREQSELLGRTWAQSWIQRLLVEGRSIRGGWPGTLQEARSRVGTHCNHQLCLQGLSPLSYAELVATSNAIYERAKRHWLLMAREGERSSSRKS